MDCHNPFLWFKNFLGKPNPSTWTKDDFNECANEFLNEFGEAPALVPLDEEKVEKMIYDWLTSVDDISETIEQLYGNGAKKLANSICTRFGVKVPTVGEILKVIISTGVQGKGIGRWDSPEIITYEQIATAIHAYLGGKE